MRKEIIDFGKVKHKIMCCNLFYQVKTWFLAHWFVMMVMSRLEIDMVGWFMVVLL